VKHICSSSSTLPLPAGLQRQYLQLITLCGCPSAVQAFLGVIDICRSDMYLHPHTRYYMRELRLVAYNQVWHFHVVSYSMRQAKQARRQGQKQQQE